MGKREVIRIWKLNKTKEEKGATVSGYINVATRSNPLFPRGAEYIIEGSMEKIDDDTDLTKKMDAGMVYRVYRDVDEKNTPFIIRNSERFDIIGKQENTEAKAYFIFHINPRNLHITKSKLITKIRTRGGFEFQHWGPDISIIAFGGTTGNVTPTPPESAKSMIDIPNPSEDNSEAYKIFKDFEILYEEDQTQQELGFMQMLGLEYRGNIFVGHLRNFGYEEVGEKPFQFEYRAEFAVEYEATNVSRAQQEIQQTLVRNADTLKYLRQLAEGERKSD